MWCRGRTFSAWSVLLQVPLAACIPASSKVDKARGERKVKRRAVNSLRAFAYPTYLPQSARALPAERQRPYATHLIVVSVTDQSVPL